MIVSEAYWYDRCMCEVQWLSESGLLLRYMHVSPSVFVDKLTGNVVCHHGEHLIKAHVLVVLLDAFCQGVKEGCPCIFIYH